MIPKVKIDWGRAGWEFWFRVYNAPDGDKWLLRVQFWPPHFAYGGIAGGGEKYLLQGFGLRAWWYPPCQL